MKELNELKLNAQAMSASDGTVITDYYGNKLISRRVEAEDYAYYYSSPINEWVYRQFDGDYYVYFDTYNNRYDSHYAINLDLPVRAERPEDTNSDYVASFWNILKTYRALVINRNTPSSSWTSIPKVLKSFIGASGVGRSKLLAILRHKKVSLSDEVIVSGNDVYAYHKQAKPLPGTYRTTYYTLIGYVNGDSSVDNYTFAYDDYPY